MNIPKYLVGLHVVEYHPGSEGDSLQFHETLNILQSYFFARAIDNAVCVCGVIMSYFL